MKRRNFLALFALSPVVAKGVAVGLAEEKLPLVLCLGKDPWRIRGKLLEARIPFAEGSPHPDWKSEERRLLYSRYTKTLFLD